MRRLSAVVGLALALAFAPVAGAHEPTGAARHGYVSTVTKIEPLILGLEARVLGDQDKLFVRNWSTKRVVVFEQDGTPLVLKRGAVGSWHDHRIGWFLDEPPALVRSQPDRAHMLRVWHIRGRAGRRPFVINGLLGYSPPSEDGGRGWILPVALVAGGLVATAVGLGARRLRRAPKAP